MPSGGCCIALWDAVDYRYVSSRLCRDNAATGFWLSVGGIGGLAVYIVVGNGTKQWRPGSVNITSDGRPSARCGNVAVVALCLLRIEKCAFMAFDALATSKA